MRLDQASLDQVRLDQVSLDQVNAITAQESCVAAAKIIFLLSDCLLGICIAECLLNYSCYVLVSLALEFTSQHWGYTNTIYLDLKRK